MTRDGFLTEADREFIRGEREYSSKHSRYDRRRAIRERTRRAFADMSLLYNLLDEDELAKIFSTDDVKQVENIDQIAPSGYFPRTLALMIRSYYPHGVEVYPESGRKQPAFDGFFYAVERGVESYLASEHGLTGDVTVSLELENVAPAEGLLDDVDSADSLDLHEIGVLELAGVDIEEQIETED